MSRSFPLGEETDQEAPLALFMNLPAGWVLERHAHDCHRFEVILEGNMIIEEAALGPGDVSTSGPGEFYGPHMAGSEGVTTLEIFSRQAGLFPVLEKPRPDSNEIHRLREQLQAHLITPAEAATDPAIDQWVKVALNERAALRKEVEERMKAPCLT